MPDPVTVRKQTEAFAEAVRDLKAAADRLGVKISSIGFTNARERNLISDQLVELKTSGQPWCEENVHVVEAGNVLVCGIRLVVQWR